METNIIKHGEIVTGRLCGSLPQQSARTVCERSWVGVPVGPFAFSCPVTVTCTSSKYNAILTSSKE